MGKIIEGRWKCPYCGTEEILGRCQSYNSDNCDVCTCCGASRTESEGNYFDIQKKKNINKNSKSNFLSFVSSSVLKYIIISFVLASFAIGGIIALVTPKEVTMIVTEVSWMGYNTYYTYNYLGDGYFEEEEHSEPIYETYYETEYYEEPVYQTNERESYKPQKYQITGIVNDKEKTYLVSFDDWKKITLGKAVKLKVSFDEAELIE